MATLDESVATFYKVKHETHHLPHGPGLYRPYFWIIAQGNGSLGSNKNPYGHVYGNFIYNQ